MEQSLRAWAPFELEADFQRSQFVLLVVGIVAVSVVPLLQLIAVKSAFHWIATLALLSIGASCWRLRALQRDLGEVHSAGHLALGVWTTAMALVVLAYVGPFSAGAIVLSPLCCAFGYSRERKVGSLVLGTATFGFLLIALFSLAGVIDPEATPLGIAARRPWIAVIGLTAIIEVVMVSSFAIARRSRAVVQRCIHRIERANVELDRRDEQLENARWDLDHVIDLAQVGHLTGTRMSGYRIGELIGRGGMGEVYRAWGTESGHPIALKVLTPSMVGNPVMVERFFREARVSSSLDSPHIVRVLDSGWADGGYPYLAMELLRGRDLAVHLEEEPMMYPQSVVDLVHQVASALTVAHKVGIVHRDIKPENIFRAQSAASPRWVVLDFGVATVKGGTGTLTQGGMIGTPRYMAPEQARGASVDPRADVFSLGAIAYGCLTGRRAFDADDALGALVQVMGDQPVDPAEFVQLNGDVELVLALALAKDPKKRLPSAVAFATHLAAAVRGELAEPLRRDGWELLRTSPWSDLDAEPPTMRTGEWAYESGDQRIHTSPLPSMSGQPSSGDWPQPRNSRPARPLPPVRELDDSVTSLAAS